MMYSIIFLLLCVHFTFAGLPGPLVYVITPATKNAHTEAPYYYSNWRRNMDVSVHVNKTVSSTMKPKPTVNSPDLIFAEFEADDDSRMDAMRKTLRKLLEREKVKAKNIITKQKPTTEATTTSASSSSENNSNEDSETFPKVETYPAYKPQKIEPKEKAIHKENFEVTYEKSHELPVETPSLVEPVSDTPSMKVEDVWHVIDNEKATSDTEGWEEVLKDSQHSDTEANEQSNDDSEIPAKKDSFVYPGFSSPSNENESRAIRTESKLRFPYVNLKTYQMKHNKNKQGFKKNSMVSLDEVEKEQKVLKGVAYDNRYPIAQPSAQIDRYNPAQPHLDPYSPKKYSKPVQAVSSLVPPPRPPPPPQSNDVLPPPATYESFPPYPPNFSVDDKPPKSTFFPTVPSPEISTEKPQMPSYALSDYQYKPPSKPASMDYAPPSMVYSSPNLENAPPSMENSAPSMISNPSQTRPIVVASQDVSDAYQYKPPTYQLPAPANDNPGYSYMKPTKTLDYPPAENHHEHTKPQASQDMGEGYQYKPPAATNDNPGYSYMKPTKSLDYSPAHSHHEHSEPHYHAPDTHDDMPDTLSPPPMDDHMAKPDYPSMTYDTPNYVDLNSLRQSFEHPHSDDHDHHHHDFDHHDFEHYHEPEPSTTEMPRVNRYSYYYLGKKLYYLPLYFSVYFVIYVAALIIKSVLRHKIVYPNSWHAWSGSSSRRGRSIAEDWSVSSETMHDLTRRVTNGLMKASEKYMKTS